MQDHADQQGMTRFLPMIATLKRAFRIDKNVCNVLDIANFVFAAPHRHKRIVPGRATVGRIKARAAGKTRPPS